MRTRDYLSPSSLSLFRKDRDEFYLHYLSDHRPPENVQSQPMSVGSAFDAYAKNFLHEKLFGKGNDPRFDLDTIFEAQVQKQWRDYARKAGKHCFDTYLKSGALADLMLDLQTAVGSPRFEFDVKGVVNGERDSVSKTYPGMDSSDTESSNSNSTGVDKIEVPPMILLGKPDLFFINHKGAHVILDWKVNGYLSKYNISPMKGYIRLRSYKRENSCHKDVMPIDFHGMRINCQHTLDELNEDWAAQLAIYSWLCGCEVGEPAVIYAIDQLCCNANKGPEVLIEIAEHRLRIGKTFQQNILTLAQKVWNLIYAKPFHFYEELSLHDSQSRCDLLDARSKTLTESPEFMNCL